MKRLIAGLAVVFVLLASFASAGEYTVKSGDCLSVIGQQLGMSWRSIAETNNIESPYTIYVGQKLEIPSASVSTAAPAPVAFQAKIAELKAKIAELELRLDQMKVKAAKAAEANTATSSETVKTTTTTDTETATTGSEAGAGTVTSITTETSVTTNTAARTQTKYAANDKFNMYMSVGGWKSNGTKKESNGTYYQAKVRYRPFTANLFNHKVGIGGFVAGETGSGETSLGPNTWPFDWKKITMGPTFKVYGSDNDWSATTDLGWARQWDKGASSKQITDSFSLFQYVNLEQRRADGKKLLPQTELMFSLTAPFSASKETKIGKSLSTDNKSVYGLELRQSVYDFHIGDHTMLTPGISAGLGKEAKDSYNKVGGFLKFRAYSQDILTLDASIKKKENVDGSRTYWALMFNVGGAIKAYKASRITEPTAQDLIVPIE